MSPDALTNGTSIVCLRQALNNYEGTAAAARALRPNLKTRVRFRTTRMSCDKMQIWYPPSATAGSAGRCLSVALQAAPSAWALADRLRENASQMALIGKAGLCCNFREAQFRFAQERLCPLHPALQEPAVRGYAHRLGEGTCEMAC